MIRMNFLFITVLCSVLSACSSNSELTPKQITLLQCDVLQSFMMGRNIGTDGFLNFFDSNPAWPNKYRVVETEQTRIASVGDNRKLFRKAGVKGQTIDGFKRIQKTNFSLSDCTFTGNVWNMQEDREVGKAKSDGTLFQISEYISYNKFSRVGFNKKQTQGIFYWLMNCNGGNCHTSAYVIMKKVNGVWVEDDIILMSVG